MPLLDDTTAEGRAFISTLAEERTAKIEAMRDNPAVMAALSTLHAAGCEPHIVHAVLKMARAKEDKTP